MAGFDRPDAPGRDPDAPQFDQEQHLGDLLVIQVHDVQRGVETQYGPSDVIVADVHVIGRDATIQASYPETWLFGKVLFSQLREKRGRTVLGILEKGEKRPGKNAPWRLADANDTMEAVALRAMASKPDAPVEDAPASDDPGATPEPVTVGGAEKAPWE
jgi:hypothetical protein